jgi:hypothetical protein
LTTISNRNEVHDEIKLREVFILEMLVIIQFRTFIITPSFQNTNDKEMGLSVPIVFVWGQTLSLALKEEH